MPEAIAAPAAPAAAAPAVSAPAVETPAAAPQTPSVEAAPQSEPVAAPAAASTPAAPAEPKQEEFEGDVEGFLIAHSAWERGDEQKPAEAETKPPEAETKPAEVETKIEEDQPWAPEPEEAITPEALNALAQKAPELQAAMDASPEVKNALFQMARINAKAAPILEVFPNVESAKFAAEAAGTFVNIRTGFMEAVDSPESFPTVFAQFADEFALKDKDGKPVMDAEGNPQYEEDFHMLNDYIVDTYHNVEIEDLTAALAANQFTSEADRENADMALQALKFVQDWKSGKIGTEKPDLSSLSPEAKAYYEKKEREIEAREAALGGKEKNQSKTEKAAERATYETSVSRKVGGAVGKRLGDMLSEREKTGVFVPSYVLTAKDPQSGISVFAKNLLEKFEEATYGRVDQATGKVIGGVAFIRNQAKMLARRPPSPEAEQARVDFALRLIDEHLPAIFDKELRTVQRQDIEDRKKRTGSVAAREELATREPKGGAAPIPKPQNAEQAMQQAYAWVDEKFPDLSPAERTEKALIKKNELSGARY
ncbi:MAG: hypothetical protein WB608_01425 [Terracidiphilus sp.]